MPVPSASVPPKTRGASHACAWRILSTTRATYIYLCVPGNPILLNEIQNTKSRRLSHSVRRSFIRVQIATRCPVPSTAPAKTRLLPKPLHWPATENVSNTNVPYTPPRVILSWQIQIEEPLPFAKERQSVSAPVRTSFVLK